MFITILYCTAIILLTILCFYLFTENRRLQKGLNEIGNKHIKELEELNKLNQEKIEEVKRMWRFQVMENHRIK
jgi:hypothetical protein